VREIVERTLAPLVGLALWLPSRRADVLNVELGPPGATESVFVLEVACAWRIAGPTSILLASGDLFSPADPHAELETFDWDVAGASWWDAHTLELAPVQWSPPPVVATFAADAYGGFRLVCAGGTELEAFPNSSPSPHVETEFWRLHRRAPGEPWVVVGTSGIELVHEA
jgi:hypothetical protein